MCSYLSINIILVNFKHIFLIDSISFPLPNIPDTGSAEELQTSLLRLCNGMDTLGRAREMVKRRLEAGNNPELEHEEPSGDANWRNGTGSFGRGTPLLRNNCVIVLIIYYSSET